MNPYEQNHSLNPKEVQQFSSISDQWWDENGPFAPLHALNPTRIDYIIGQICQNFDKYVNKSSSDALLQSSLSNKLEGLEILDAGCGGGLVCEPLARLGAQVTGIDADENAIKIARDHADMLAQDFAQPITYEIGTSESLLANSTAQKPHKQYDIVLGLEIIEHVNNPEQFVQSLFDLTKPGGIIIFSTLNRTLKSYLLGIIAAEYIAKWVPKGTHTWKQFVKPHEIAHMIRKADGEITDITGIIYQIFSKNFALSKTDLDNNYILTAKKPAQSESP